MNKLILIGSIIVLASSNLNAKSLCLKTEKTLFTCVTGKKIISYCGQPNKFLEYRFGTPKRIELSYRVDANKNANNKITHAILGNDIFFFKNKGYFYTLSIPMKGLPNLQVKKDQRHVSSLECKTMSTWSGGSKFLSELNQDQIQNLDDIL